MSTVQTQIVLFYPGISRQITKEEETTLPRLRRNTEAIVKRVLDLEKATLRLLPQENVRKDWDLLFINMEMNHLTQPYHFARCLSSHLGHESTIAKHAPIWRDRRVLERYPRNQLIICGHPLEIQLTPLEQEIGLIQDRGFQICVYEPGSLGHFIKLSVIHSRAELTEFSCTLTLTGRKGLEIIDQLKKNFGISSVEVEDGSTTSKCLFHGCCNRALVIRRVLGVLTNDTGFYEKFGARPIPPNATIQYSLYNSAISEIGNNSLRSSFEQTMQQWEKNCFLPFYYQQAVIFLQTQFKLAHFIEDLQKLMGYYPSLAPLHDLLKASSNTNERLMTISDVGAYLKMQSPSDVKAHENWHYFQETLIANRESICLRLYLQMLELSSCYDPYLVNLMSYLVIGAMRTFYSIPENNGIIFYDQSMKWLSSPLDPFSFASASGLESWPCVFSRYVKNFTTWASLKKNAWAKAVNECSSEESIRTYRIYDEFLEQNEDGLSIYFMALKYLKITCKEELEEAFRKSYDTPFLANKILVLMEAYKKQSQEKTSEHFPPGHLYLLFKLARLLIEWQSKFVFEK